MVRPGETSVGERICFSCLPWVWFLCEKIGSGEEDMGKVVSGGASVDFSFLLWVKRVGG